MPKRKKELTHRKTHTRTKQKKQKKQKKAGGSGRALVVLPIATARRFNQMTLQFKFKISWQRTVKSCLVLFRFIIII